MICRQIGTNVYFDDDLVATCANNEVARIVCEALNTLDARVDLEAKVERLEVRANQLSRTVEDMQVQMAVWKARGWIDISV